MSQFVKSAAQILVEQGTQLFPMEIKSGQTLRSDFFKNITFFQKIAGVSAEQSYLIYAGSENQDRVQGKALAWDNLPGFCLRCDLAINLIVLFGFCYKSAA